MNSNSAETINTLINNNEKTQTIISDEGEVFMVRLPIIENPTVDHIIMKTNWYDDEEQIKIRLTLGDTTKNDAETGTYDYGIDCVDAYEAIIRYSQIRATAIDLELNVDEFFNESKLALTTQNGYEQFKYLWRTETSTFVYHKQKSERIKIIFGSICCSLHRITETQMIKSALALIDKYRIENEAKDKLLERYAAEEIERLRILEQFKDEKIRMEIQLTNKYAAVLNTLKGKIKYLNDVIEKYRSECSPQITCRHSDMNEKCKNKLSSNVHNNSMFGTAANDNEADSDDDDGDSENISILLPKRIKLKAKTDITSMDVEQKKSPKKKEIDPVQLMATTNEIEDILDADTQLYEKM